MEKNQKILLCIIGILLIIAGVIGFLAFKKEKETPNTVVSKFKEEYEVLNGVVNDNGYTYPTVDIDVNYKVEYLKSNEILEKLDDNGVIYFGNAKSFNSRNAVNSLIKASDSVGLSQIYYFDTEKIDVNSEEYIAILDKLDKLLKKEEITDNEGQTIGTVSRELIIPTVVIIEDGEILDYHVGTIEKENLNEEFTKEEKENLYEIYVSKLIKVSNSSCNEHSKC